MVGVCRCLQVFISPAKLTGLAGRAGKSYPLGAQWVARFCGAPTRQVPEALRAMLRTRRKPLGFKGMRASAAHHLHMAILGAMVYPV
jgi:hypothetical protein